MTLSCLVFVNNDRVNALASDIDVTTTDNQVTIENDKLEITSIVSKCTAGVNTVFEPIDFWAKGIV